MTKLIPFLATVIVLAAFGGAARAETWTLESDALEVRVAVDGAVVSVRDKRSGRVWGECWSADGPSASGHAAGVSLPETLPGRGVSTKRPPDAAMQPALRQVVCDSAELLAALPDWDGHARYSLDGAELLVEVAFKTLPGEGRVFPEAPAPGSGDAAVMPISEGFRIPFAECGLLKGSAIAAWRGDNLSMPFCGVVDASDECGWMAILETPEDAGFKCPSKDGLLVSLSPLWMPECGKAGYPRRVRFVFFDKGGYVAMAKRYRAFAAEQGLVKTFAEKAAARPLVGRLPGAANIWYFPSGGEPSHAAVAAELREAGIDRFLWSAVAPKEDVEIIASMPNTLVGRYDVCRDVYYPELLDALGRDNPPKSEICNNTSAWPDDVAWDRPDSNAWRRAWGATGKDGKKRHCAAQCDIPAIARLERLAGAELAEVPFTARFIDVTAAIGWEECYNPSHPMTRRMSRKAKTDLLRMLGEKFGIVVGSEQGMDAFVPVCDYFEGMLSPTCARMPHGRKGYWRRERFRDDGGIPSALASNEWDRVERYALNEKYRIPLFELVYHDCVASHWYWYDYSNSPVYYWWKRDLFNALYGAAPMYIFDYRQWRERKAEFVQSWKRVGGIAREAGFSEMLSHRALTPDRSVQETRYANGLVVVVDFNRRTIETGVRTANGQLMANLVGAQVTSWRPVSLEGGEVFFMQGAPQWGKEVHGGVPICWPWFGGHASSPSHGLVRYVTWKMEDGGRFMETPLPDGASLTFVAESTPETKALWPHDFRLRAEFTMPAPDTLEIAVTETNTGDTAFESAFGLHPYLAVADAEAATVDGNSVPPADGTTLKIPADGRPHVLGDTVRGCSVAVLLDGADSWRLWNPGESNRYVAPGEWRRFICLEPIRETPSSLLPGESRTCRATFRMAKGTDPSFAPGHPRP